ncbi:MAG TPA: acetyl-CoA carboxylase biotin carboxyl carrier protein [Bacteroidota bacterium]|nr:acetyl-CoA carboxylase biotin carboxyl carrier protein [Bacteroidota bacterium]
MDLNYVRKLVKLLSESSVDEIEIEEEGKKIRVAKNPHPAPVYQGQFAPAGAPPVQAGGFPAQAASADPAPQAPPPPATSHLHEIKSPIVGTFYKSPAPDAAPFVQVGSVIRPGAVLCIVEAMKLMNEIEADVEGKIVKIMVENGQPVEYDQTLFLVEKAS